MKILLVVYIVSVLLLLLEVYDCGRILKKNIGKALFKAWNRRKKENNTIIGTLKSYLMIFLPVINTLYCIIIFFTFDSIVNELIKSVKKDCTNWGIDFEKSKHVESDDYIVALEELEGIKRVDKKEEDDIFLESFSKFLS